MTVHIDTTDRITTLRLDRPAKKNALTIDMYVKLAGALEAARADAGVRAVVLTGSPDCFTAGNDLVDFARASQGGMNTAPLDFLHALAALDKPVVAAVAGVAIGIGTTMLLHCDVVIAAPDARFATPFVALGLVPEAASSLLLPALIGARRASQLLLLGEQLDAATAHAWGLVTEVADDPLARATAVAMRLAASAPNALQATKALMRRASREAVLDAMRAESDAFAAQLRSPEAIEALQAFLARRSA